MPAWNLVNLSSVSFGPVFRIAMSSPMGPGISVVLMHPCLTNELLRMCYSHTHATVVSINSFIQLVLAGPENYMSLITITWFLQWDFV